MITKYILQEKARQYNLKSHVIEKDYVLSWVLAGINENPVLKKALIFKGGTALKKCYFGNYRFSEDLDYTVIDKNMINPNILLDEFKKVATWIYEQSGLRIANERTDFDIYQNSKGLVNCQGRLYYQGPISPTSQRQWPRIKLDFTTEELVVQEPVEVSILHDYDDFDSTVFKATAYCFEEVLAEKIRAIEERCMPRDVYDVVYCLSQKKVLFDYALVQQILVQKCKYKNISPPSVSSISRYRNICNASWDNQLVHQISELDSFENTWLKLENFLKNLNQLHLSTFFEDKSVN